MVGRTLGEYAHHGSGLLLVVAVSSVAGCTSVAEGVDPGSSVETYSAAPSPEPTASGVVASTGTPLYLAEVNVGDQVGQGLPVGMLAGVKGVLGGTPVPPEFADRLRALDPQVTLPFYGPQAYDSVIIAALAAAEAGSDAAVDIAARLPAVTSGEIECATYATCIDALASGKSIAYRGPSGVGQMGLSGEPLAGKVGVYTFGPDNTLLPDVQYRDVELPTALGAPRGPLPEATAGPGSGDGVLRFGIPGIPSEVPDFLQPSITAGVRLAVADIQEAGGVPGFAAVEAVAPDPTPSPSPRPSGKPRKRPDPMESFLARGLDVVVSPGSGSGRLPLVTASTEAGVLVMAPVHAPRRDLPQASQGLLWSVEPGPALASSLLGSVVRDDGHASVAILAVDNPYGRDMADAVAASVAASGGAVVSTVFYPEGATDVAREVAKVKRAAPDAIVLLGDQESAAVILEMARQGIGPQASL